VANDVVRQFTGKPGPFLSRLAFVSDREKARPGQPSIKEVYLMDWDGENQWRLTFHNSLSLSPDWAPGGQRIVYQSYFKGTPGLSPSARTAASAAICPCRAPSSTRLPRFLPTGSRSPSAAASAETRIFVVGTDGTGLRRLTDNQAVDSTPRWAPNGRELAFTSSRQGSPQIYFMDSEGATSGASPSRELERRGQLLSRRFADRLRLSQRGDFQICVHDLLSARTFQISTGDGAHENPTWSPDGSKIAWELTREGVTQIVVANVDGTSPRSVTSVGNNTSPSWSKTLE